MAWTPPGAAGAPASAPGTTTASAPATPAPAPWTPAPASSKEAPPFFAVYGETNTGKSTDAAAFAGNRALFICQPGAMRVARTVLGIDLSANEVYAATMEEVPALVYAAKDAGYSAVVVDDGSLLMKRTAAAALDRFKTVNPKTGKEGIDFAMYSHLGKTVTDASTAARWCGLPMLMTFHVQASSVSDETKEVFPQGPDLHWRKLVRHIPHESDTCLWSVPRPFDAKAWDTRADCDKKKVSQILVGDRYDVAAPSSGPLNSAELVRAAGWPLPRPVGLEWMEAFVEQLAQAILSLGGGVSKSAHEDTAWASMKDQLVRQNVPPPFIRWIRRDGTHRARIRAYQQFAVMGDI